jgi:16S rRNA (cytidine1402-2'-O)-methyltransferase
MAQLFVVPTPIGNLEDMTFRAIRVLKEADFILAEDTRTSRKLLSHFDISSPLEAYHMHNEHQRLDSLVQRIAQAHQVALISDAGTPGISDPGYLLVSSCIQEGIDVVCLPGATAFVPALVMSGFPTDSFVFEGFLPHKKGRLGRIQRMAQLTSTVVLYESPHRLLKTLQQMHEVMGDRRRCAVIREISKIYEEVQRGTFAEMLEYFGKKEVKGEIVMVLEALPKRNQEEA